MKRVEAKERAEITAKLTPPSVPYEFRRLWSWCADLIIGASSGGGFGGLRVTWLDVDAWARRMKRDPSAWQCKTLLYMTGAFIKASTPPMPKKGQ